MDLAKLANTSNIEHLSDILFWIFWYQQLFADIENIMSDISDNIFYMIYYITNITG